MRITLQPWLDLLNKAPQNHYFAGSSPSSIRQCYSDSRFVHELHRLYNLQKKVMQELEINGLVKKRKENLFSSSWHETSYVHISQNQNDLKATNEENDLEVELTLGIGQCTRRNRGLINETNKSNTGSCSRRMNNGDSGLSMNNSSSSSYNAYQEKNTRPHWLIRDLSSNRT
ncbi:DNA gyrase subunit A, partial [Striga asiatica]